MFAIKLISTIELAMEVFATKFVFVKCWHCPIDCHDGHDLSKP